VTEIVLHTSGLEPSVRPRPVPMQDISGACCVTVYDGSGKLALALGREGEALVALKSRLAGQGYTVVTALPAERLATWAHPTTPHVALKLARNLLLEREAPHG